jgi:hypothetical protein
MGPAFRTFPGSRVQSTGDQTRNLYFPSVDKRGVTRTGLRRDWALILLLGVAIGSCVLPILSASGLRRTPEKNTGRPLS